VFLIGGAAQEELPLPAPDRCAHVPRTHQFADPRGQRQPARQGGGLLTHQRVLGREPGLAFAAGRVLKPAIRVPHEVAVQVLGEVEAARAGVANCCSFHR
jgi:hypothetical protein